MAGLGWRVSGQAEASGLFIAIAYPPKEQSVSVLRALLLVLVPGHSASVFRILAVLLVSFFIHEGGNL